jgi:hypothetical protein
VRSVSDDVQLKSYEQLREKHRLGGELDTNLEKLDARIAEVRREMDGLLPTKAERDRRDTNSLTEEDEEKAKKWFELEEKLKDLKVRRACLERLRPAYFASKSSKLVDKAREDEENRVMKESGGKGGNLKLPSTAASVNLDVESLRIKRPIMVLNKDPEKQRGVQFLDYGEGGKLVNWQVINRRRAKQYLKEHGSLEGFEPTKNFDESLEVV